MGCRKFDSSSNKIWFTCPCGLDVQLDLSDLDVAESVIVMPACTDCGRKSSLFVNNIAEEDEDEIHPDVLKRNIMNQTVFQKLKDLGKTSIDSRPLNEHVNAKRLISSDNIVEAPVHPDVRKAKEKKDKEAS